LKVTKLDAYKCWEFRKNIANESPLKYKFVAKIRIFFTVLGAVFPHLCSDKREIWHGERTYGPLAVRNFTFIGARQCVGPAGRQIHFCTSE